MSGFYDVYRGRRVLVTGHTGFKGSWLVSWLELLGAEVCGYANGVPTKPSLFDTAELANRITHEIGDIRDRERLRQVIFSFRPDFVFHLAAQAIVSTAYNDPLSTIATNVMGTAVVLDVLREVDWTCNAVIITSDKAYENVEWIWGYRENDRLGGKDVYSASKGAAELIFHAYCCSFAAANGRVRLASARAGNVIGGGDWAADRIVADCIRSWQDNGRVSVRSPRATRPWQHVLEPLSGYLLLAAELAKDPTLNTESFNFGPRTEQNETVLTLLKDLASVWGMTHPEDGYEVVNDVPFHEASLLKLNIDKAVAILGWQPTLTYAECVEMTGGWYRDVAQGDSAYSSTHRDILRYESLARERRRGWTQ